MFPSPAVDPLLPSPGAQDVDKFLMMIHHLSTSQEEEDTCASNLISNFASLTCHDGSSIIIIHNQSKRRQVALSIYEHWRLRPDLDLETFLCVFGSIWGIICVQAAPAAVVRGEMSTNTAIIMSEPEPEI